MSTGWLPVISMTMTLAVTGDWVAPLAIKAKLPPRAAGTTTAFKAKGDKCSSAKLSCASVA